MSQTMTLSEPLFGLVRYDVGVYRPARRREPSRYARVARNGFWDIGLAVAMVLLAPLAVVVLGGAFAMACWRMQWLDGEVRSEPVRPPSPAIETAEDRFLPMDEVQSIHLWN